MNHFMARLIFCFFAEDTGIFVGTGLFTDKVTQMSAGDATNTPKSHATLHAGMAAHPAGNPIAAGSANGHVASKSTRCFRHSVPGAMMPMR
jgi:hypothetical protein